MSSIELNVQDMTCGSCVKHVTQALSPLAGVEAVEVDLQAGRVRVSGNPDSAALIAALDDAGYPAQLASPAAAPAAPKTGGCGCH
ncbi:heavy-metal-associated domain-containing protein [Pseudomonas sp. MAP12]|uniref:Heavy-metal-associated domain-containing protein n=1 Tax=Geopseudomonas aromaticivorans TaxID=2849492 RepID=A0ABS6MS47_9GAMM|nr:heavy metal-associated domain-containing protein [Pseudomonas aromaticivorans]MBV2131619.1 heavy-metal-associated domain-containing protein [Pseudomonas aromaticivorans]